MKRDERITASSFSFRHYIIIFLFVLFFCGSYGALYFLQIRESGEDASTTFIVLSMFTYLIVISIVVCFLFAFIRKKYLMPPIIRLSEAARRVANGDFSVRVQPMRQDGKLDEFEILYKDFNTMAAELASTEVLKNDFVSNVSHEIKTPLAIIQNYAMILQSEQLSEEERRNYTARISDAAKRLSVLVSDVLQISRLENQKIKPVPVPFNLSESISRCILDYDTLLDKKNIVLETDLDENITVESDEHLLSLVWNNLLSNAVKFTPENGTIYICAKEENGRVTVCIRDNGCGISEEAQKHIFDKFYQADTSHATQGNGLGLALCQRITDLLGCEIKFQSASGEGTTFSVYLP